MSRYFLTRLKIEGFRGINNDGDPLDLIFKKDTTNSVFGENGRGKSSIFEALTYAVTGKIPKLVALPADENAEDYYCNRFHSLQSATIGLTIEPESGAAIEIRVMRDSAGNRTVDSPSGYPDPEKLLQQLGSELTLLDYSTFRHFVEDSPLKRGRAFSALLGLTELSSLRQTLEVISQRGNLKSDFSLDSDRLQQAQVRSQQTLQARTLQTAHKKLLGVEADHPLNCQEISASVCAALEQVHLAEAFFVERKLSEVDFGAVRAAIRKADASDKRAQLEAIVSTISALDKLVPLETEKSEREALKTHICQRDDALKATKGPLFFRLYADVHEIFEDGYDVMTCPACEFQHSELQDEVIRKRLETYEKVSAEQNQIKSIWEACSLLKRLRALESSSDLAVPPEGQKLFVFNKAFTSGEVSYSDLGDLTAHLDHLEEQRRKMIAEKTEQKDKLRKELPPSLVVLMEQVQAAEAIQTSSAELERLAANQKTLDEMISLKERWVTFITDAEASFAQAEIALSTAKTTAFEAEYRKIYERITGNPSIVPVLQKAKGSEELHLGLEKFYTLADVSAATLLPESYRNALAISIYLTAALQSAKPSRFVVLDDVTSSFDAGHQFNLMQVLQSEVLYPQNPNGLQVILFSHDGMLEKFFDKMSDQMGWNHYRLDGLPPCGNVLTTRQDSQRIKADAERFLNAGQVAQAKPLVRQYLEYSLLRIIRKLQIPVPLDFAIRDETKLPQACLDAINEAIELHSKANSLILSSTQLNEWKNVCVPQIMGNLLAHYATGVGASISPHIYLSVLDSIDSAVNCFTYQCTCGAAPRRLFYRNLSQKQSGCRC